MKKTIVFLGFIGGIISPFTKAQQRSYGDFPNPVPSVSSMASYQETPVAKATGTPDINIPITGIGSVDKSIFNNLIVSYNPNTVNNEEYISQVGSGWTLFSGGVISRTITESLDERFSDAGAANYTQNKFDDIYYYNLPTGIGGKFKISRQGNNFTVNNETANNVEIEYTRTSNTATLIIDSFTIRDDKGYQYIFNDYSQNLYSETEKLYRSAFFLSSIKNASGVELMTYEYQKDTRNITGTSTVLYQSCKLKKVNSPGLGNVKIDYLFNADLEETMNDPYTVSKITTENSYGKVISQYNFDYTYPVFSNQTGKKRILTRIKKMDLDNLSGNPLEVTGFEYSTTALPENAPSPDATFCMANLNPYVVYPKNSVIGILKRITLPTGGVTEYNFEPNEFFLDKNTPEYIAGLKDYVDPYIQNIQYQNAFNYNTSQSSTIQWNISGDPAKKKKIYFIFHAEPGHNLPPLGGGEHDTDPGDGTTPTVTPNLQAGYTIDNNPVSATLCSTTESPTEYTAFGYFEIYPGNHTIQITTSGRKGNFTAYELVTAAPPYNNIGYWDGVRIKDIKNYTSASDTVPAKTISYSYNLFNSLNSSGEKTQNESYTNDVGTSEYILYSNIQETKGTDEGYIRYYMKTPVDYPDTPYQTNEGTFELKHYYNITKSGLLEKKEIYNADNQKISGTDYEYELQDQHGTTAVKSSAGYVRPGIIKYMTTTEKNYISSSQVLENKTEQEFTNSSRNFQLEKVKTTSSDGEVYEKTLTYPFNLVLQGQTNEYANINNANMKGIAINTTEKKNGKTVSSVDMKFAGSSLYPTYVISTNPNDSSTKTAVRYDVYDSKGNIRQFTAVADEASGQGVPNTIIWGYNDTYAIAKVEGATVNDVNSLMADIITKSNQDIDEASEKLLLEALDTFRTNTALKNFKITTYTYNPLVGATSVTSPNGMREIYKYDTNNRLKYIVDTNGNILKDYRYNTKPQP